MADPLKPTLPPFTASGSTATFTIDFSAGAPKFILAAYNYMASGLLLTGIGAMLVANSGGMRAVFFAASGAPTLLGWIAVFAPLALEFTLGFGINRLSESTVTVNLPARSPTLLSFFAPVAYARVANFNAGITTDLGHLLVGPALTNQCSCALRRCRERCARRRAESLGSYEG